MIADFKKKANRESSDNELLFKAVGIIFFLIVLVLIIADFRIYNKKRELLSQITSYQKQIEDVKKNSQTLKEEIANSDNKDYLEKIAYEQLGEAKPGETVYSFVKTPETQKPVGKSQNFWKNFTGWLSQPLNWLKSKF